MAELTPDDVMTVAEVAATLKLNQQTVRNWIDAGTLPALRVGRRVRIKRSDFDQLIADSEIPKVKPAPVESIWDGHIPPPVVSS
jgi:excisionase family DNA binding protein